MGYVSGYRNGCRPEEGQAGNLYLLHIEPGLPVTGNRIARHYLGWTNGPVAERVERHLSGQGSPLVRAAIERGQSVTLVRTWEGVTRNFERKLKRHKHHPRLCPHCNPRAEKQELPTLAASAPIQHP